MRYEDMVNKAISINSLGYDHNNTSDTRMLRGIGYAILVLAQAIKDGAQRIAEELEYSRRHQESSRSH